MKTLRMITCFLIASTFVLLLLIPGKAQASDVDGIWAVEVKRGLNTFYGTWIVGVEDNNSIFGACTWIDYPEFVDGLSGILDGGNNTVTIDRTTINGVQTYKGTLYYMGMSLRVPGQAKECARTRTWDVAGVLLSMRTAHKLVLLNVI